MMMLPCYYKERFVFALSELSDFSFQEIVWQGHSKTHVSDYIELMCNFFDDLMIEHFIENDLPLLDLSSVLKEKFKSFEIELSIFNKRKEPNDWGYSKNDIYKYWSDTQWIKLSKMAKDLLEQWGKEDEFVNKSTKKVSLDHQKVIQEAKINSVSQTQLKSN